MEALNLELRNLLTTARETDTLFVSSILYPFAQKLKENNTYEDFLRNFEPTNGFKYMCKKLWMDPYLEELIDELIDDFLFLDANNKKDEAAAIKCKDTGNEAHTTKKDYPKALEAYNKALSLAPQPFNIENIDFLYELVKYDSLIPKFNSDLLWKIYRNRSYTLYEMGAFELSLLDIKRAIFYGYSVSKDIDIIILKVKCILAMSKKTEAKQFVTDFTKQYDKCFKMQLDSSVGVTLKKLTDQQIDFPPSGKFEHIFATEYTPATEMTRNLQIPCLSDAAEIQYSEEKGRHIIAKRDINPGELLSVQRPYETVVYPRREGTRRMCFHCIRSTLPAPVPCPFCKTAIYCSEECLNDGLKSYHIKECEYIHIISKVHKYAALILKIVYKIPLNELKEKIAEYEWEEKYGNGISGFNMQNTYTETDYRAIFYLPSHYSKHTKMDLLLRAAQAVCLTKFLIKFGYLGTLELNNLNKYPIDNAILVSSVLLKHLFNIPMSAIDGYPAMGESHLSAYLDLDAERTHSEIYGMNFFNHSCFPNLISGSYNGLGIFFAKSIQFVAKGEELTVSYTGFPYSDKYTKIRQEYLENEYFFTCKCVACLEKHFPLSEEQVLEFEQSGVHFRIGCSSCQNYFNISEDQQCPWCKIPIEDLQAVAFKGESEYVTLVELMQAATKLFPNEGENSIAHDTDESFYLERIKFLSKYTDMRSKEYFFYVKNYVDLSLNIT